MRLVPLKKTLEMSPVQAVSSEVRVEMNPSPTPVSSESVVNNTQTSISV